MSITLPKLPQPTPIKTAFGGTVLAYGADQMHQYADDANAALREQVRVLREALESISNIAARRDVYEIARAALEATK